MLTHVGGGPCQETVPGSLSIHILIEEDGDKGLLILHSRGVVVVQWRGVVDSWQTLVNVCGCHTLLTAVINIRLPDK